MSSPAPAPTNVISMSRAGISLASAPPISPPIKPANKFPTAEPRNQVPII